MLTSALPLIVACFFAGVLGFAAHRASICTVRAVAEIMSARTGYMLWSIGKSALWVIALTLPFLWLMPEAANAIGGWRLTLTTLLGGFLFGLGAALNGACAYSTMARLVDGEARMAVSVGGFAIGVLTFLLLVDSQILARPEKAPALIGSALSFALVIVLGLAAWAIYEVPRIWRMRPKHLRIQHMILSPQYRLSSAALVIGIASSIVFLLVGSPGYAITLHSMVAGMVGKGALPAASRNILMLSVLAGMLVSTLQRGSFRLDWRPQLSWLRNIFGGALMGLGAAMVPGGNAALILYAIPSFSLHALPAFAALIVGAGAGLLAMKHLAGVDTRVVCRNDIYRAEAQPKGSILNSHAPQLMNFKASATSTRPSYSARPAMAPASFLARGSSSALMSSMEAKPPEAMTGIEIASANAMVASRLRPLSKPSRAMSV